MSDTGTPTHGGHGPSDDPQAAARERGEVTTAPTPGSPPAAPERAPGPGPEVRVDPRPAAAAAAAEEGPTAAELDDESTAAAVTSFTPRAARLFRDPETGTLRLVRDPADNPNYGGPST